MSNLWWEERFGSVINPSGGGGAPGNDDRSIVVKSRYLSQYSPGEFFLKMSDQSVLESVVVGLQK